VATITGDEFIRRFLQPALPPGFQSALLPLLALAGSGDGVSPTSKNLSATCRTGSGATHCDLILAAAQASLPANRIQPFSVTPIHDSLLTHNKPLTRTDPWTV
jgi:hypothetical protein